MHTKDVLAEMIYKLNDENSFALATSLFSWSAPTVGFLYDNSLQQKFLKDLRKKKWVSETNEKIICILADWDNIAEGIVFTDKAIHVNSPKNSDKCFHVYYDKIIDLTYLSSIPELQIETAEDTYSITSDLWSKLSIHDFLQFATENYDFCEKCDEEIKNITLDSFKNGVDIGSIAAGITYGNVSNASSLYNDDKIVTPRGHGFAAEHANHLADLYMGKKASIIGDDNLKNGADRLVDGVQIQSKYCASGSKCISECFENGQFRYWNPDGTPMQIEVPSDMYESALQSMRSRIEKGEVAGVTDPNEAERIIRKGHFTYNQVKNIAKAGTVESIIYDAASGAIIARNAFGVTAVITFANALWNDEDLDVALKSAAAQGLKVGGTTFVTAVLAGQLSKAGLNSLLVGSSEAIVQAIGPKASAVLVNAFRSGTNIYGAAAMKSAAKLLRGNAITGIVSITVLSVGDVANIFQGRISGGQLFKNLLNTASTVAGGSAGWVAGATAGAALGSAVPIIGTAIGGIAGGLLGAFAGGNVASTVSGAVLDEFIEDDANYMVKIIQDVFAELATDYLTTQDEAESIVENLQGSLTGGMLKDMFASSNRHRFAKDFLEEYFVNESNNRKYISLPTEEQMQNGLKAVLEDMAD